MGTGTEDASGVLSVLYFLIWVGVTIVCLLFVYVIPQQKYLFMKI